MNPATTTRVLLIDDSEFAYVFVEQVLGTSGTSGFSVDWRATYDDGLRTLIENQHDVCLLDYRLGDRDGLELLNEAQRHGCRTPVIMLTSEEERDVDVKAMRAGASDYLIKGNFQVEILERAIRYSMERARAVEALRESEERYELASRAANDGIWDWKWELGSNGIYFSPRWKSLIGYQENELDNKLDEWYSRVHPNDIAGLQSAVDAHLNGVTPHFEAEYRLMHKDGQYRWMLCRGIVVRDQNGKPRRMAGSQSDVTLRAAHDALTGLPNRALFVDCLERAIARTKRREDYRYGVMFIDLDRFKIVNDSLGHTVGDELLVELGRTLKQCVRGVDVVARLGGDEFAIFLDDIRGEEDAFRVASRIHEALSSPFTLRGREVYTTASVGITLSTMEYERPEDILRDADTAMYRAKAGGRARHEIFDQDMHARVAATLRLETALRRAVDEAQFEPHYQPILSLATGKTVGFEALVRWRHDGKMVPPLEFIPIAEETGLCAKIDHIVLVQGAGQVRAWQRSFVTERGLSLSVNVSSHRFWSPNLISDIDQVLCDTGLDPSCLTLELTENVIMENADAARQTLVTLKERGIRIAMDDFGTGYSSLSNLHLFPIDVLKIDRSFVAALDTESTKTAIIEAIIALTQRLQIDVVAEGVELASQAEALKRLGCTYAQGYYFSRPLPVDGIEPFLRKSLSIPPEPEANK